MRVLMRSLDTDAFKTPEQKIKELCKVDGVGKEKAKQIVKYLFADAVGEDGEVGEDNEVGEVGEAEAEAEAEENEVDNETANAN